MTPPIPKYIGATLGILGEFRDVSGNLVDPATVTAGYIAPDLSTGALSAARPSAGPYASAGHFAATKDSDQTGKWTLWIKGDDTADDVQILEFMVQPLRS